MSWEAQEAGKLDELGSSRTGKLDELGSSKSWEA